GNLPANDRTRASSLAGRSATARRHFTCATTAPDLTWLTRRNYSARSSGCTARRSLRGPASAWPPCNASYTGTAARCGRKVRLTKGRHFISYCNQRTEDGENYG